MYFIMQNSRSLKEAFELIHYLLTLLQVKQEGVAGLFKGVVPVMIRAFPANAVSEELRVNFICGLVVQQVHRLEFSDISGVRLSPKPLSLHHHRPRFNSSVPIYTPGWEEAL